MAVEGLKELSKVGGRRPCLYLNKFTPLSAQALSEQVLRNDISYCNISAA